MLKYVIPLFTILLFLLLPKSVSAQSWYYPLDRYYERQTLKGFGQFINDKFYQGKENLFPFNRFYGYHAGVDLEAFPWEKDKEVPVYAVSSGTIIYIGNLPGYGGIILQTLDSENNTALYGHVKIKNLTIKQGDHISVDQRAVILTFLGDEFSEETAKERKHLHFGISKGSHLYFRGHEDTIYQLAARWYDPSKFLEEKKAQDPILVVAPKPTRYKNGEALGKSNNLFYTLVNWLKNIFKHE